MRKKMKWEKIKKIFKGHIKETRGAVSLFLALTMSPLLSITLLLVESDRYQCATELMQEVADCSAFSTLAEYDSYLDERFGVLAVSQENSIDSSFSKYLNSNKNVLGKDVTISSQKAQGMYPLSNTKILKQQILEYSELSVATELLTEGMDLDDLLDELVEKMEMKEIKEGIDAINTGIELAQEVEKLVEAVMDTKGQHEAYATALGNYKSAYSDFESKAVAVAEALKSAEENLSEDDETGDVYSDSDVKDALKAARESRDAYKQANSKLKEELDKLRENIDKIFSSLDALPAKVQSFHDAADETLEDECTTSTFEWMTMVVDQVTTSINAAVGNDYRDGMNKELILLDDQIIKLGNYMDSTIDSEWDAERVKREYGVVNISTINESFGITILDLLQKLDAMATVGEQGTSDMNNMVDIVSGLLGVSGLYDSSLNAKVSTDSLYADISPAISGTLSIYSLTTLVDACEAFRDSITSAGGIGRIVKVVKAVVKLMVAIVEFLMAVIAWVGEVLVNAARFLFSGPKEWYNGILLYGYGAYNMPNRTTYKDGSTISGYDFSDVFDMAGGVYQKSLSGAFKDLKNLKFSSGSDQMFKGAEAEYLLAGTKSEEQNQCIAFFDLYLFRLIVDACVMWNHPQINTLASVGGPAAWAVKILIILAEAMLDTIILVNGGTEYLKKDTLYFSYAGFVVLQNELVEITAISDTVKDKIKDVVKAKNGEPKKKGKFKSSYTEHIFLLTLLSVSQETYLQRLQNLIQMEAAYKYRTEYEFALSEAYTYVCSDVKYRLNPMFKFDGLVTNNLFTAHSRQYTGY